MSMLRPSLKTKPHLWPHQEEALNFVDGKSAAMLAMAMGTGKSRVVVDLLAQRQAKRALVLCPSSVVDVWPGQFQTHCDVPYAILPLRRGSVKHRTDEAESFLGKGSCNTLKVVVINYDACYRKPFSDWAVRQQWDAIILDESHRIKAPGGVTSRWVARLAKAIPFRLALTGTPMPHSPLDIYAQYRALDQDVFGTSFARVRDRYAVQAIIPAGFKAIKGYRVDPTNLLYFSPPLYEEFQEKFFQLAYKVDANVLELPEPLHQVRTCELSPRASSLYRALEKEFYVEIEEGVITASNALVKALRLQQVTSGYAKLENDGDEVQVDTAKQDLLRDILEDLNEPVVIFCRFRHDLDAVHTTCAKLEVGSLELSGRVNELAQWQAGDSMVLAVQIQAGGVGIDLTRARVGIYYSLGLSLGDHLQSLARIHRPGQTRNVVYYYLLAERTIDRKVYHALLNRQEVIEAVMRREFAIS